MSRNRINPPSSLHTAFIVGEMGGVTAAEAQRNADEQLRYVNRRRLPVVAGEWNGSDAGAELARVLQRSGVIDNQTTIGIAPKVGDHGLPPTIVANANLGTTGTASVLSGNDSDFVVEMVPGGSSIASGNQAAVTFSVERPDSGYTVQITPLSSDAAALAAPLIRATSRAGSGFTLARATTALTSGQTYQWSVSVREG